MDRDLASFISEAFSDVLRVYQLRVVRVDAESALIVGKEFALWFSVDRFELGSVQYIERRSSKLASYVLGNLILDRWTTEDCSHYGNPTTREGTILSGLRVHASGFYHRCPDLPYGETSWLKRDRWRALVQPRDELAPVLDRELPR